MRERCTLMMIGVFLVCAGPVAAQHAGDIFLTVENGQLVTGAIDQDQNITTPVRVFAAEFGDSGCDPFTANPGFDAQPGTFQANTQNGWNAVEGLAVWNGGGFEPVDTEWLEISFISQSFSVFDGPASGFGLFVQSDGGFHRHLDFCMMGCPNGCNAPADADPGIYLLTLEVYSTDSGVATSEPFWMVFNYLDSASNHDAAIAWAQDNLGTPVCAADLAGDDATVNVFDLLALLSTWGTSGAGSDLAEPDDVVNVFDLLELLSAWGDCAP